ncbi:MAG: MBL fold metallo-hydrolase [Vicingaceae bacterium]
MGDLPIKITFLGTGTSQGIPVIACECDVCQSTDIKDKRLRTSILIESPKTTVVIDAGPDFRQQLLRAKVKKLDAVIFTHEHKDHISGLDDVRAFNYQQKKPMPIFATQQVQNALKREYHYVFSEDKYPGIPQLELHTIDDKPFVIGDIEFLPIAVWHYKMPVKAFRIKDFCYITDANRIEEEEFKKIEGVKTLVLNALRKEPHISHFTLNEAIELSNKLHPKVTYFTHISHLMGKHAEVQVELPENIFLAYDGLTIYI